MKALHPVWLWGVLSAGILQVHSLRLRKGSQDPHLRVILGSHGQAVVLESDLVSNSSTDRQGFSFIRAGKIRLPELLGSSVPHIRNEHVQVLTGAACVGPCHDVPPALWHCR